MTTPERIRRCAWCGTAFTPRATGGAPQRFCGPPHRRAWNALREATGEAILTALVDGRAGAAFRAVHASRTLLRQARETSAGVAAMIRTMPATPQVPADA